MSLSLLRKKWCNLWISSWEVILVKTYQTILFASIRKSNSNWLKWQRNSLVPISGSPDIGHILNYLNLSMGFHFPEWLSKLCTSPWISSILRLLLNWVQQFQTHNRWTITSEEDKKKASKISFWRAWGKPPAHVFPQLIGKSFHLLNHWWEKWIYPSARVLFGRSKRGKHAR